MIFRSTVVDRSGEEPLDIVPRIGEFRKEGNRLEILNVKGL